MDVAAEQPRGEDSRLYSCPTAALENFQKDTVTTQLFYDVGIYLAVFLRFLRERNGAHLRADGVVWKK